MKIHTQSKPNPFCFLLLSSSHSFPCDMFPCQFKMSLRRMVERQLSQISPVTDQVFLTGVGGVSDIPMLLDAKITHVLNVAAELKSLTYPEHVEVKFVSLRDSEDENLLPHFDELTDYIHEVVKEGGRIVVHCVAGISRSASVCIAYLMKYHDMSLKEAHANVKDARDVIYPNLGFWTSLVEYELQFRDDNSVELLPFVAGSVPSLESYKSDMMKRMKLGWMDHVFFHIFYMLCLLLAQMISVLIFRE